MPKTRRKTAAKHPAHKPSHKHPERLDLRAREEDRPAPAVKSETKTHQPAARLKRPGEDKLKKKEIARRKREIARKIKAIERRDKKAVRAGQTPDKAVLSPVANLHERDKYLIMYAGVGFFMVLIAFFWVISLKHSLKETAAKNSNPIVNPADNFNRLNDDFLKTMEQIKTGLNDINAQAQPANDDTAAVNNTLPDAAAGQPALSNQDIQDLKDRLGELKDNSETTNDTAGQQIN